MNRIELDITDALTLQAAALAKSKLPLDEEVQQALKQAWQDLKNQQPTAMYNLRKIIQNTQEFYDLYEASRNQLLEEYLKKPKEKVIRRSKNDDNSIAEGENLLRINSILSTDSIESINQIFESDNLGEKSPEALEEQATPTLPRTILPKAHIITQSPVDLLTGYPSLGEQKPFYP